MKFNHVRRGLPVHAIIGLSNGSVDIQTVHHHKSEGKTLTDWEYRETGKAVIRQNSNN